MNIDVTIAMLLARGTWEIFGLTAVVVTLIGVWLNWRRSWHIADIEEDLKNAKCDEHVAWRRMKVVNWRATAVLVIGVALLFLAAAGLGL